MPTLIVIVVVAAVAAGVVFWVRRPSRKPAFGYKPTATGGVPSNSRPKYERPPEPRDPYKNWGAIGQAMKREAEERRAREEGQKRIICQFCQEAGHVTATLERRKQGVSGGKATAALLTGGVSLVAVGLSKKGFVTHLACGNCGMTWDVA